MNFADPLGLRRALLALLLLLASVPLLAAQRIVTLAPHLTELVYAAGAGERLVGTVAHSDHPAAARRLPRIGDAASIDQERLVALRPDLILAWRDGTPAHVVDRLRRLGLRVESSHIDRLDAVPDELRRIGRLVASPASADTAATVLEQRIHALPRPQGRPIKVFYQLWDRPLYTIGGGHFIDDIIRRCGGINLFADLRSPAASVDPETILVRAPEAIVAAAEPDTARQWFARWRRYASLPASRAGRFAAAPPEWLNQPGPRLIDGAEWLCGEFTRWRQEKAP